MITRKLIKEIGGSINFENLITVDLLKNVYGLKVSLELPFKSPNEIIIPENLNFFLIKNSHYYNSET